MSVHLDNYSQYIISEIKRVEEQISDIGSRIAKIASEYVGAHISNPVLGLRLMDQHQTLERQEKTLSDRLVTLRNTLKDIEAQKYDSQRASEETESIKSELQRLQRIFDEIRTRHEDLKRKSSEVLRLTLEIQQYVYPNEMSPLNELLWVGEEIERLGCEWFDAIGDDEPTEGFRERISQLETRKKHLEKQVKRLSREVANYETKKDELIEKRKLRKTHMRAESQLREGFEELERDKLDQRDRISEISRRAKQLEAGIEISSIENKRELVENLRKITRKLEHALEELRGYQETHEKARRLEGIASSALNDIAEMERLPELTR